MNTEYKNPIKLENHVIYVDGTMYVDTDKFPNIGIQSKAYVTEFPTCAHVIDGDLFITDINYKYFSSFTVFLAKGDIVFRTNPKNENKYISSQHEFDEIMKTVTENTPQLMLRLLYVSIFSRFEMYMIQIAKNWSAFKLSELASINNIQMKNPHNDCTDHQREEKFFESILKGSFTPKTAGKLIYAITKTNIHIPESLKNGLDIRNDIVHRDGYDVKNKPIVVQIGNIHSMDQEVRNFLDQVDKILNQEICQMILESSNQL